MLTAVSELDLLRDFVSKNFPHGMYAAINFFEGDSVQEFETLLADIRSVEGYKFSPLCGWNIFPVSMELKQKLMSDYHKASMRIYIFSDGKLIDENA